MGKPCWTIELRGCCKQLRSLFGLLCFTVRRDTIASNQKYQKQRRNCDEAISWLYPREKRRLPGTARRADGAAPRGERGGGAAGGKRRQQQGLWRRVRHVPVRRHGRLPHSGALGAGGLGEVPREIAVFAAAEEQHGVVPQRDDLPGQDGVPLCDPQRDGFQKPDGRVPERGVLPAGHGGQGRV